VRRTASSDGASDEGSPVSHRRIVAFITALISIIPAIAFAAPACAEDMRPEWTVDGETYSALPFVELTGWDGFLAAFMPASCASAR
jgi:hypothetical protein